MSASSATIPRDSRCRQELTVTPTVEILRQLSRLERYVRIEARSRCLSLLEQSHRKQSKIVCRQNEPNCLCAGSGRYATFAKRLSAARTRRTTSSQSPARRCRNSRKDGYQGLSSRSSSQRHSGRSRSRSQAGLPSAPARCASAVSTATGWWLSAPSPDW